MARELSAARVVIKCDASNDPDTADMEYSVVVADGTYDDVFEPPKRHNKESPNFNQTVTAFCGAVATSTKTTESI